MTQLRMWPEGTSTFTVPILRDHDKISVRVPWYDPRGAKVDVHKVARRVERWVLAQHAKGATWPSREALTSACSSEAVRLVAEAA